MAKILPQDLLELQLSQIDLLLAMYPEDAQLDSNSDASRTSLIEWIEGASEMPTRVSSTLSISLNLDLSSEIDEPVGSRSIVLELIVPIKYEETEPPAEPSPVRIRIIQPGWMSKAEVTNVQTDIPDEDLLGGIEYVREACVQHIKSNRDAAAMTVNTESTSEPLVRVWFYFPSISTRSKRDDLINHGPSYGLSGFLLAGKPGILCLEGGSKSIDDYMKFIKTDSWGDIPAHHKKVSERHRETGQLQRVFDGMQEITDLLGERRGERANRNDMKAVEAWLEQRGLGDAFKKVLM
ncbi:hypothetical protein PFICI_07036 [Pestalotiopsis fici W106-1]|uniref:Small nuclear ribonucleoprotein Prp3 C-terminal domain-containing protein n=1 Tax=Pestalotiopsis fici (strain W106-1 / CGMCC3.15140) TaxID=1229662 RepID=W3X7N1_PESFW|nr:uncharacterized protein PFICI_07036 [Pestalotiopsis fici W106-1]ETS82034.1 hypothetical protein PFICI_07036 [Pestalotiopsis fici W106-1]